MRFTYPDVNVATHCAKKIQIEFWTSESCQSWVKFEICWFWKDTVPINKWAYELFEFKLLMIWSMSTLSRFLTEGHACMNKECEVEDIFTAHCRMKNQKLTEVEAHWMGPQRKMEMMHHLSADIVFSLVGTKRKGMKTYNIIRISPSCKIYHTSTAYCERCWTWHSRYLIITLKKSIYDHRFSRKQQIKNAFDTSSYHYIK